MLRNLKLQKYRGFDEYELSNLSRVNLLVGKNDSGKTSILEAIHFLVSRGDPDGSPRHVERLVRASASTRVGLVWMRTIPSRIPGVRFRTALRWPGSHLRRPYRPTASWANPASTGREWASG